MGRRALLSLFVVLALLPVVVKAQTCTVNSDCPTACDAGATASGTSEGTCLEGECVCCTSDSHCAENHYCTPMHYCSLTSTGGCTTDSDCSGMCIAEYCDGRENGFCVEGVCKCCDSGHACSPLHTCSPDGFCEPPSGGCDNDGICETGEACDNCGTDCGCGSGYHCDMGTCVMDSATQIPSQCGNGVCEDGEDCGNCPGDCQCAWEQEQQQQIASYKASLSLTSDELALATTIMDALRAIHTAATAYMAGPSATTAYNLAYQQRLNEQYFWDLEKNYQGTTVKKAAEYAILNYGSGRVNAWNNEFGEFQIGGIDIIEGTGIRFGANLWYNDWENKYGLGIWINWDTTSKNYEENIKNGWRAGEEAARTAQAAEDVKEIMATFTITDENKEIANELIKYIDTLYQLAKDFSMDKDKIYKLQYEAELLNARMNGLAEGLGCSDMSEVSTYILVYSKGSVQVWDNEFGEKTLAQNKRLLDTDYVKLEINAGGCGEWSDRGWMGTNVQWSRTITGDTTYKDAITKARKAAWKEAEALRKRYMVLEAKKKFTFTVEEENTGKEIIDKLNSFKAEIQEFEAGKISAYQLHYDSILLTSELEGYSWAYQDIADGVGTYVMLNGPGVPDVWKDEFGDVDVGNNLRVHFGENIEFNFNRWCDDWNGRCGFNSWMNWGNLKEENRDDIKRAERDGWREAERLKRRRLAEKFRNDLSADIEDVYSSKLKEFVSKAKDFIEGGATAYDVELARLEASYMLEKGVTEKTREFIMVLDLGEDVPPPEAWMEWETGEINIGGWRELVISKKDGKEDVISGMDAWCDDWNNVCGGNVWMNWPDWASVKKDIHKANDQFWRQKREEEIKPVLEEIISKKTDYSSGDQSLIDELVTMINSIKDVGDDYAKLGVENFQYNVLLRRDGINDKLVTAQDGSLIELAVAKATGYHDYDDWMNRLYGVAVYTGDSVDLIVRFSEKFTPFFLEDAEETQRSEYAIEIEIVWKEWEQGMEQSIENAYERYETEQSSVRLAKLVENRARIISEAGNIEAKVNAYENGQISLSDLRKYINSIYFRIQSYDQEVAYFAAMAGQPFPNFEPVDIKISTEHVNTQLYERTFEYRFGGGVGLLQAKSYESAEQGGYNVEFAPTEVQSKINVKQTSSDSFVQGEYNEEGFDEFTGDFIQVTGRPVQTTSTVEKTIVEKENVADNGITTSSKNIQETEVQVFDEDVAREIETEKQQILVKTQENLKQFQEQKDELNQIKKVISKRKGYTSERLTIQGIKPRLKLRTEMTDAEILRLSEELKSKWEEAAATGYIDDAVYNMNMHIDSFPALQEAITAWGSTAVSLRLNYKGNSVFEFSFKTDDGYIDWIKYGVAEDAGSSNENIYIEIDFESLLRLRNWWEERLKNAEGILDLIGAVPGFIGNMIGMLVSGEIKIQPFGAIAKIPQFLSVFFEGMVFTTGVEI